MELSMRARWEGVLVLSAVWIVLFLRYPEPTEIAPACLFLILLFAPLAPPINDRHLRIWPTSLALCAIVVGQVLQAAGIIP